MNQLELAEAIARKAHAGQFRNDGVTPYITHPEAVAESVNGEALKAIAWLHDVLEDTSITKEQLIANGIDSVIAEACSALNHREGQTYLDYILTVSENKFARAVKIADIKHNIQTTKGKDKRDKYEMALWILTTFFPAE